MNSEIRIFSSVKVADAELVDDGRAGKVVALPKHVDGVLVCDVQLDGDVPEGEEPVPTEIPVASLVVLAL